jgi:hypothetical protein
MSQIDLLTYPINTDQKHSLSLCQKAGTFDVHHTLHQKLVSTLLTEEVSLYRIVPTTPLPLPIRTAPCEGLLFCGAEK